MNRILFFIAISFFTSQLHAQTSGDALRYSRLDFGGTARSVGVGGALGAFGTDFSVLSTNPAGLAAYRSSDFMITPSFKFMNVSSELAGSTEDRRSNKLLLDNIGFVVATQPLAPAWESMNFGIGINKVADFNRVIYYEGQSQGSIVDRFAEQAEGRELDELYPFEEGLAYDTEALFDTNIPGSYGTDFQDAPNALIGRNETIETTGYINELVFSFATNLKHKLMMGLTIGVPILRYTLDRTYQEQNINGEVPNFNDLTFSESITTSGAGINLKLGIIYRPIQMVRVGLAVHTPTVYSLTDQWENTMNYDFTFGGENFDLTESALNGGPFDYNLRTPGRVIGSLGFLFKKRGFLSAEVEYLDYTSNSFDLTNGNSDTGTEQYERSLNQEIEGDFDSAINLRLGGELAFNKFRVRAGYAMFGTSYADKSSFDPAYSLGLGIREKTYYMDLAYRLTTTSEDYTPYLLVDPSREQQITAESSINKIIFTLGFRF